MKLNDRLKNSLEVDGKTYEADMSFNNVLDIFDVLKDNRLFLGMKLELIIKLLFGRETDLPEKYWLEVWKMVKEDWIDVASAQAVEYDVMGEPMPVDPGEKSLDFEYDAKYIYASFRQIGINLFEEQGKMHWEEFQALLEALPEDTIIQRIRSIRTRTTEGLSGKQKAELIKLKNLYALPNPDRKEE